mgnify:CR=1 FL=1|jgi:hypothetical protein
MKLPRVLLLVCIALSLSLFPQGTLKAGSTDREIQELKEEIKRLQKRVEELEKKRAEEERARQELEAKGKETEEKISLMRRYIDRRIERFSLFPSSKLFITGYGSFDFVNPKGEPSTFATSVFPIFHYAVGDRTHFIIEPEIELEEDEVDFGLEIGELDFFLNDYLTLVAGKFLLPFNVFSERLHPSWINKMPAPPIIYGHGHDGGGIVPVLSDIGIQLRGGAPLPLFKGSKINYAIYLVNGPRISEEEHVEEGVEGETHAEENHVEEAEENHREVELEFGRNFTDINSNKAFGGRVGILPVWNMEIGASIMHGEADGNVDFTLIGFDGEYHLKGLELRGEFIRLEHDTDEGDEDTNGFYLQGAYRLSGISLANEWLQRHINRLEPVIRYGKIFKTGDDISQVALGIDYWILPSFPIKIAYEFNDGIADRFLVQLALGF